MTRHEAGAARRAPLSRIPKIAAALAAVCALGACDFPTAPPIFETRLSIPGETTTLTVDELLPSTVTTVGNTFRLRLEPVALTSRTLGEMCGAVCQLFEGMTVPKPGFVAEIGATVNVPDDIASATVTAGSVTVTLTHNFGFDPLQPSGRTEDGYLALVVRNGTRVVGRDTVRSAFPSGSTITRTIQLAPGTIAGDLDVDLTISSPAGGSAQQHWVPLRNAASLGGSITPGDIVISEARVLVRDRNVNVTAVSLDLTDIDTSVQNRVQRGTLVLTVDNPLGVTGTMTLTIAGGSAGTVTKQLQVTPGRSVQRIEFTGPELRSLLGHDLLLSIAGPVSAPDGTVTVRPGQVLIVSTRLDLVVRIGGSGN